MNVAKVLIEKGANVEAKNIYNKTPLYYASKMGKNVKMIGALRMERIILYFVIRLN